jgi:hypothetical protein
VSQFALALRGPSTPGVWPALFVAQKSVNCSSCATYCCRCRYCWPVQLTAASLALSDSPSWNCRSGLERLPCRPEHAHCCAISAAVDCSGCIRDKGGSSSRVASCCCCAAGTTCPCCLSRSSITAVRSSCTAPAASVWCCADDWQLASNAVADSASKSS